MGDVQWVRDAPTVSWLGAVVPEVWYDSGCGGPRARWLPDGRIEVEDQGVPEKPLPAAADQWLGLAAAKASKYDVPAQLVVGVLVTESSGDPKALSPAGAAGLMQLMPATANDLAKRVVPQAELLEPDLNVDLGTKYVRQLWDKYKGNPIKIAAAYNAGSVICGAPKKCPTGPNQWNVITDCSGGKAVDYPMRMFSFSNAALKKTGGKWDFGDLGLGGVGESVFWKMLGWTALIGAVGFAAWKSGAVRGLVKSNPLRYDDARDAWCDERGDCGPNAPARENPRPRLTGAALKKAQEKTRKKQLLMKKRQAAWDKMTAGMTDQQIREKFFPMFAAMNLPKSYYVRTRDTEFGPYSSVEEASSWGDDVAGPGQYEVVSY